MPQIRFEEWVATGLGFVWWLGVGGVAGADPPRIEGIAPAGVCRGVATEVVVSGANLAGRPRWLGSFGAEVETVAIAGPAAEGWRVRVTPGADVPVGVYLVRVQTEGGLSNPFPFAVDQFPHMDEVEDNDAADRAQPVATPVVVEGRVAGADVDCFRFAGRRGERILVDAACARVGSGVDPSLRLSTAGRRLVAAAEDTPGLVTDARLFAELPADGDYVVELADARYQGAGPRSNYRLLIAPAVPAAATLFPLGGRRGETVRFELAGGTLDGPARSFADVAPGHCPPLGPGRVAAGITEATIGRVDPVPTGGWWARDVEGLPPLAVGDAPEVREPADPAAPPLRVAIPAVCNGRIEAPGDGDTFAFVVAPGQKVRVAVEAAALGSMLDGVLEVRGAGGAVLAGGDDSKYPSRATLPPADPKKPPILSDDPGAELTIPAGTTEITVYLRDLNRNGGPDFPYRLTVEPVVPGFALAVSTGDQANIPRGGTAAIGVEVDRRDFAGPIALDILDPPPGLTVRPGLVPAGQAVGALTVSAAADAEFAASPLRVVGTAAGPAGPITVAATRTTIVARQADFATHVVEQVGLPAAPAAPAPATLAGPDRPVELVLGYAASFPVRATRAPGAEDVALTFASLPTVPNLAVAADPKLAPKAVDGTVTINSNPDTAPGPVVLVVTAKGKFADRERTIALPAVALDVVRPAEIVEAPARVELVAGAGAEVRGRLVRRGPLRDPITAKLDGLPPGLKADPVVVPPDATDFVLRLVAEPTAPAAEATARLALALKLGPRDYAPPSVPIALKLVNP